MLSPNITVVIHTEEEFDWNGGFFRSKNQVTHGAELIEFSEQILSTGVKLVLAMDYAFVSSEQGSAVISYFKEKADTNFEFATHLHPWVNPPFCEPSEDNDKIDEFFSYPGNLSAEDEEAKLLALTNLITSKTGMRPTTYLAGRYGIGANTHKILKRLGYLVDLSISPFTDFSTQQGPNFSEFNNSQLTISEIQCIPHTTGYISHFPNFSNYLNKEAKHLAKLNCSILGKIFLKLMGVKRVRLSPEGFNLKEMIKLYKSLKTIGVNEFIFSFHSPSVKVGFTKYVESENALAQFKSDTLTFLSNYKKY